MNRLKALRTERNLTQDELSKASGVGRITIARIENGSNTSLKILRRLAAALGCTVEDLITEGRHEDRAASA